MVLGLLDTDKDPLVRGTTPTPDLATSFIYQEKKSKKNLDFNSFLTTL
jgi:hypothetical protein